MKIEVGENREIVLKDVYTGVLLVSPDKEEMGICMRDGGFEVDFGGIHYSMIKGKITILGKGLTK